MKKKNLLYLIPIAIMIISPIIAFSQITQEVNNRKEFTFCQQTSLLNTVHYLNGTLIKYDIEGCPSQRIYINNWNEISPLDQQALRTQLLASGWQEVN